MTNLVSFTQILLLTIDAQDMAADNSEGPRLPNVWENRTKMVLVKKYRKKSIFGVANRHNFCRGGPMRLRFSPFCAGYRPTGLVKIPSCPSERFRSWIDFCVEK